MPIKNSRGILVKISARFLTHTKSDFIGQPHLNMNILGITYVIVERMNVFNVSTCYEEMPQPFDVED